jgi:uncharacterized C2H2 Zn-finger protein
MKNAALRLHHQDRRRPGAGAIQSTDEQVEANDLQDPLRAVLVGEGGCCDGGYQHAEITSSKATKTGAAAMSEPDITQEEQNSFPRPARRVKMLKKRQNLRQKLKSNLQASGHERIAAAAAAAASTAVAAAACPSAAAPRQQHVCAVCDKIFPSAVLLRKHARFHVERSIIPCAHCHALFERQWQYESHLVTAHGLAEQHACPDCDRVFSHRSLLLGHVQTSHKKVITVWNRTVLGTFFVCFFFSKKNQRF